MECFHPINIPIKYKNAEGKTIETKSYREVPCGTCAACRERNQQNWIFRLSEELKHSKLAFFVTYTYDDQHIPIIETSDGRFVQSVKKRDFQLYLKRLRKRLEPQSLRYYVCSEYGEHTFRPHYHAIMFYNGARDFRNLLALDWTFGFISIGSVTTSSIAYTTKYVLKGSTTPPGACEPFCLSSRNPAIGLCYLDLSTELYHMNHDFVTLDGRKLSMPRYLRDKLHFKKLESDSLPVSKMEETFFKDHPNASYEEFYLWRDQRQKMYEENRARKSKHNSIL